MLTAFCLETDKIVKLHGMPEAKRCPQIRWIDLHMPTKEEEAEVESLLGINVPTKDEMREIEPSSRVYEIDGVLYLTAALVSKVNEEEPELHSVSFVLTETHLVTVRYTDPTPFAVFMQRVCRLNKANADPALLLAGLLEAIVDRLADIIESVGQSVDGLTKSIFRHPGADKPDYSLVLHKIGRMGDLTFKARESLASLVRVLSYLEAMRGEEAGNREIGRRTETMIKDATAVGDYAMFVSGNIAFLLDGTLGIIGMEQNATIKIFSVVAVVFMPPTLVASIYGMNFTHMPELNWEYGYPMALVIMLLAAWLPYRFFKLKGWL